MFNELLIFIFSLLGIVLFVFNFKHCKKYLNRYAEIFGIVAIVLFANWLLFYFFYEYPIDLLAILEVVVRLFRNLLLATLATYYFYDKFNINPAPLLVIKDNTTNLQKYAISVLLFYILSLVVAITILLINGSDILVARDIRLGASFLVVISSFLESFGEEIFVRLFLMGFFINLFGKSSVGIILSIMISSLVWSTNHFILGISLIKFALIFLLGILWGILMHKKGIESTVIVHGLYNSTAYLLLGVLD